MNLQSLGHASMMYQQSPGEIASKLLSIQTAKEVAAVNTCPTPAVVLNGIAYYDSEIIQKAIGKEPTSQPGG